MRCIVYLLFIVGLTMSVPYSAWADIRGPLRVIDGDTVDVSGTRVRLYGIDAPEQDQTCTSVDGIVWECGAWVTAALSDRYNGKQARCVPKDIDRYGRTVATCFVDGTDIAKTLVQDGLAFAYRKYSVDYDFDEKGAAIRAVGLHGHEMQSPAAFRRTGQSVEMPATGCRIKGNISSKGVRIYHRPGQRDYGKTRISERKGELWFCSDAEAKAAGWRPARR